MNNILIEKDIGLNLKRMYKTVKGGFFHKSIGKRLVSKIKKGTINFMVMINIFSSALGIAKDFDGNVPNQINSIVQLCKISDNKKLEISLTQHFEIVIKEIELMIKNRKYLDAYKRARYLKIIASNLGEEEISKIASSLMSDIESEMRSRTHEKK